MTTWIRILHSFLLWDKLRSSVIFLNFMTRPQWTCLRTSWRDCTPSPISIWRTFPLTESTQQGELKSWTKMCKNCLECRTVVDSTRQRASSVRRECSSGRVQSHWKRQRPSLSPLSTAKTITTYSWRESLRKQQCSRISNRWIGTSPKPTLGSWNLKEYTSPPRKAVRVLTRRALRKKRMRRLSKK